MKPLLELAEDLECLSRVAAARASPEPVLDVELGESVRRELLGRVDERNSAKRLRPLFGFGLATLQRAEGRAIRW